MTIELSQAELANVLNGQVSSDAAGARFHGAHFDSREIKGGELFVALKGKTTHGHGYLDAVFAQGASLALVEDPKLLEESPHRANLVCVEDTLQAWGALAKWWRAEHKAPLLGITGSVGKTTLKEMAAAILLQHSRGYYSLRSYNNEVGVPFSLSFLSTEYEWIVQEMGMNEPGEMRHIAHIACPDVAVIGNVKSAHIENFADIHGVADAKFEITEGIKEGGLLIVPSEDEIVAGGLERSGYQGKVEFFGKRAADQASVSNVQLREDGKLTFTLTLDGEVIEITLNALGEHNALNAACAALAAKRLVPEITSREVVDGLVKFRSPPMRLEVRRLSDGRMIVDDSYNANRASMSAAFAVMNQLNPDGKKKVGLILGDMLELGANSEQEHLAVGSEALSTQPAFLIAVGKSGAQLVASAKEANVPYFQVDSAVAAAQTARKLPFDLLLVKASRGTGLDKTVQVLLETEGEELPEGAAAFQFKKD